MAMIFLEGFDKYCPAAGGGDSVTGVAAILQEWTSCSAGVNFVTGLSATGQAFQNSSFGGALMKTLPGTYTTFYCGFRFNPAAMSTAAGVTFQLSGTAGISIVCNTSGQFEVRSGGISGTLKGTSVTTILSNSTHYLEMAITMSTSGAGACVVYLDSVAIVTLASQTFATATINQISLNQSGSQLTKYDDLYFFDSTGSTNNNVLLSSPRIETEFPSADSAVQFTPTAGMIGFNYSGAGGSNNPGPKLILRKYTPQVNCTINSVGLLPNATNAAQKMKGVVYSDSAGAANTLLSSGTEVIGLTASVTVTLPLVTPQALTGGTPYWIGYITDNNTNLNISDALASGYSATNTYASGAPGTAPAMTSGGQSWCIFGNLTGMAANWAQEDIVPVPGVLNYNADSTVGHEDLFTAPALSVTPSAIYGVQISGACARSDSGARTVSLRMKSSSSDSGGTLTGQTPGTTFGWLSSIFETDPNTGSAWVAAGLNAAKIGYKVDS